VENIAGNNFLFRFDPSAESTHGVLTFGHLEPSSCAFKTWTKKHQVMAVRGVQATPDGMVEFIYVQMNLITSHESLSLRSLIGVLVVGLCLWSYRWFRRHLTPAVSRDDKSPVITPLNNFDWKSTEPLQFRPFQGKEKYNLTMGTDHTSNTKRN